MCPTELGLPNCRLRFYLVAGREGLADWPPRVGPRRRLAEAIESSPDASLWCDTGFVRAYADALHVVDADYPDACTARSTSVYGPSPGGADRTW